MNKNGRYTIEQLSRMTGFPRRTIRYYVSEGLIEPPAGRGLGGFYFDSHLESLERIAALRKNGLKLSEIRALLEPAGDAACLTAGEALQNDTLVRYRLGPGVEMLVSREEHQSRGEKIRALVKLARSVLAKGK